MSSTPMSYSDVSVASGPPQPLSSHASKRFRVHRSGSKKRVTSRPSFAFRRRPESVFSRRGADTPVQIVAPFSEPLPQIPFESFAPRTSSKRWTMGRSKQPELRGCVLRAVPKAARAPTVPSPIAAAPGTPFNYRSSSDPLSHAHVDATMAMSPNDEILSNIGQSPASTSTPSLHPSVSNVPPKKSKKDRKSEGDAGRIGFWKDGRAHWEAKVASMPAVPHPPNTAVAELDSRPIRLETPARELPGGQKNKRPRIQVIIPNDVRNRAPHARPPFVSQAVQHSSAGEIISSRDVSPPLANDMIEVRNSAVSPVARQILTQRQQTVPVYLEKVSEMPGSAVMAKHPSVSSSSGASNSENDDSKSSIYTRSNRTSWTSIDDNLELGLRPNLNLAFSIISPAEAGIFDDASPVGTTTSQPGSPVLATSSLHHLGKDKPLPPEPQAPTIYQTVAKLRSTVSSPTLSAKNSIASRRNSRRAHRVASLPARGLATDNGSVPHSDPPSPTLSEAETALEEHLSCIAEGSIGEWDDVPNTSGLGSSRRPSYASARAPAVPRKSSRRKTRVTSLPVGSSANHIAAQQVRPLSLKTSAASSRSHSAHVQGPRQPLSLTVQIPRADFDKHDPKTNSNASKSRHRHKRNHSRRMPTQRVIAPDAAEVVILGIFERVHSLDDLCSLARVNRGFYRVFKRHELRLLRSALQNECPPAWEHRESSPPYPYEGAERQHAAQFLEVPNLDSALPQPEHTPTSFYRHHMRDTHIITALKALVLTRCQSFLRPETVMALASNSASRAARIDRAFWRIWTFCTIFGYGKGREDDIVGQTDWLRGGPLVHQTSIRATIMTSDSFDASGALLNAPEHFAKGNGPKGLSAEELYDMTEIWTCMGVLVSALEGRTEQAREFGVYEVTDVRGGDIDGEERMLQEWLYYLSTLGLSVILEVAAVSNKADSSAFMIALENGWLNWVPPQHDGSRRTFLKEAVARVYEEKIAAMAVTSPQDDVAEMRQVQRQRMAAHKAEIRTRRRTGDYALVRMSMERPMSDWEGVFNSLDRSDNNGNGNNNIASPQPRRHVSTSSSVMAGAPTPCPPGPSNVPRSHSELIALPPMPELPGLSPVRHQRPEFPFPVAPPQNQLQQQMSERRGASSSGVRGSQQNPLLQTLAHAKQLDYGGPSPTEQHPALRSIPSSSSFLGSESSSRRGSADSGVSPVAAPAAGSSNGRLFSEEAVHPAFRHNVRPPQQHQSSRQQQQQQQHSSNSSISSMSAGSPNMKFHAALPPSYNYQAQRQQQQQQQQQRYYSQLAARYPPYPAGHPPAHPAYPYSPDHQQHQQRHASIASQPLPQQYQQHQHQHQHHRHHSLPISEIDPPLPAHRDRVSTQHPFQQEIAVSDAAAHSSDKAIFRIVEMGFTAEEAKMALRKTDMGDGLRVDRAVELLLSR
ncbi:f-box domain protein [Diplodia corticola]|uniref:F-box domain protein n=1 Tax=Diplodia corticola TaxID=236234 RepID=A0A1J9S6J7_9PEZI|nr:f-box domain protein [Diplodia corticola]OJD35237.1 f-box domain protein [Diplodia corticola]